MRARLSVLLLVLTGLAAAQPVAGARYLIITPDIFVSAVRPLADWKTRKGMPARIVTLSETGTTPWQVRDYIRNAWNLWPVRPEYVLIACAPSYLAGYTGDNDCYYGNMTGNYRVEIPVGRLPAENAYEMQTMVAKCLAYEQLPDSADSLWTIKGTTAIVEDRPPDLYYVPDSRLARQCWLGNGFLVAESLYSEWGHNSYDLLNALNAGRGFITYRGQGVVDWSYPFNEFYPPNGWNNGGKLPILIAGTCATVSLYPNRYMMADAVVRFGTPTTLGGAVAYFGTSRAGSHISTYRSACFRGFFSALFTEDLPRLGTATVRGRFRLDSLLHDSTRYEEWTLMGDPELNVWTRMPRRPVVEYPAVVDLNAQYLPVYVRTGSGDGVSRALVCVQMDSTCYAWDSTDAVGYVEMPIQPTQPGRMSVVVTGRNLRPWEGECMVLDTGPASLHIYRQSYVDSPPGGNGDRVPNPGETLDARLTLMNFGDDPVRSVLSWLRTDDSLATVVDSFYDIGTVAGRDSVRVRYRFRVSPGCPDSYALRFTLHCRSDSNEWDRQLMLLIYAPVLEPGGYAIRDSSGNANNRLDPNETADLLPVLRNTGRGAASEVMALLRSGDARLTVLDSLADFGDIPAGAADTNFGDRFTVRTGLMLPGTWVHCTLLVTSRSTGFTDTLMVNVGRLGRNDPSHDGPRAPYLYWAYDDVDSTYDEHPAYDWLEIRPLGTMLPRPGRDTVFNVPLPAEFGAFRYYGVDYDVVAIATTGWLAPGYSAWTGTTSRLPMGGGPPMLAVNWSTFSALNYGGIYYYHDAANHRFIVEWDSMHYDGSIRHERFQVQLYDTTRAAQDGNSEFVFQHQTADMVTAFNVGIQDQSALVGISMFYRNLYDSAAAPLMPRRAIKFTTDGVLQELAEAAPAVYHPGKPELTVMPNPAGRQVLIRLSNPRRVDGQLHIYDAAGRLIRTLTGAGQFVFWDGRDDMHRLTGPGVYYCCLLTGSGQHTAKIIRTE